MPLLHFPEVFQTSHPDLRLPLLFKKVDSKSGSFTDTVALASLWLFGLKFQRFLKKGLEIYVVFRF